LGPKRGERGSLVLKEGSKNTHGLGGSNLAGGEEKGNRNAGSSLRRVRVQLSSGREGMGEVEGTRQKKDRLRHGRNEINIRISRQGAESRGKADELTPYS